MWCPVEVLFSGYFMKNILSKADKHSGGLEA
jgi:hypothetical protein